MDEGTIDEKTVLYIGKDLFLSGPIRQVAQSEGWGFRQADPEKPLLLLPSRDLVAVFDLSALKETLFPIVSELRKRPAKTTLVGISFHTDTENIQRGQQAGIDRIVHRSRMGYELKTLLHDYAHTP